jgi:predicted NBD/HSP70 family sugar kinase
VGRCGVSTMAQALARELGVKVLVAHDSDSYGVAAAELGLSHDNCAYLT